MQHCVCVGVGGGGHREIDNLLSFFPHREISVFHTLTLPQQQVDCQQVVVVAPRDSPLHLFLFLEIGKS